MTVSKELDIGAKWNTFGVKRYIRGTDSIYGSCQDNHVLVKSMVNACLFGSFEGPGILAFVHGVQIRESKSPEATVPRTGIIEVGQ